MIHGTCIGVFGNLDFFADSSVFPIGKLLHLLYKLPAHGYFLSGFRNTSFQHRNLKEVEEAFRPIILVGYIKQIPIITRQINIVSRTVIKRKRITTFDINYFWIR